MRAFWIISGALFQTAALAFADPEPVWRMDGKIKLVNGSRSVDGRLEFTGALHYAEADSSRLLHGAKAASIGGWFFPRRSGDQYFMFRGAPETGPSEIVSFGRRTRG